jgi:hypothetical protein
VSVASISAQRMLIWTGPALMGIFFVGFWVLGDFIPPPSPERSPQQVVEFFRTDTELKRLGLWMVAFAGALVCTWSVAISCQLRRIEGSIAPLAYVQMLLGALLALEFIFPTFVWQAILYRPETTSAELTYRLNDVAWLPFVGVVSTGVLQAISIGIATLMDTSERPVFPRWCGYFNFWVATTFMPAGLVVFFKHGPFAWNGVLAWWLLLVGFFLWLVVMTWLVLGNLREQTAAATQLVSTREVRSAA